MRKLNLSINVMIADQNGELENKDAVIANRLIQQ